MAKCGKFRQIYVLLISNNTCHFQCGMVEMFCTKDQLVNKVPVCIALYHEQLTSKVLMYGTCY